MKLIRIYCLICICLCAEYSIKAEGEASFRIADSLMLLRQYQFAAIEYERVYFYSENIETKTSALLRKSACLKAREEFELAEKCLMRVNYFGLPDSLAYLARYQTALCAYLGSHFTNAESQLLQIPYMIKDTNLAAQSLPLYAMVLNELQKWNDAKLKLLEWINSSGFSENVRDSLNNEIEELYSKKNIPKLKKQEKARILSSVIPGTGQIYAGYFWEGAANAALQGTALLVTAYAIYSGFYVTALVVPFGVFQKFYAGALMRTEYLVEKKNYELTRKFNDRVKNKILSIKRQ